jgi:NADH dehydrogenase/NADH:ubiquinone oxidoreductase subunit G
VLGSGPVGLLASPDLTNEAIWLFADALRAALPGAAAGFWPGAAAPWPLRGTSALRGAIKDLPACKTVVLVDLDPWVHLPVLALWIRKAVLNGGTLIVIGEDNGLYRDTAHWLRVPIDREVEMVEELLRAHERAGPGGAHGAHEGDPLTGRAALAGREPDDAAITAAARALARSEGATAGGPAALLIHPRLAASGPAVAALERLAEVLGAGEGGMVGSPTLAANGRGALELAGDIATVDPRIGPVLVRAAADELAAVLLVGRERWPETGRARRILVTTGPFDEDRQEAVDVVLPMAHPYEQAGSLTNLEGRVQLLQAAGLPPQGVPPDWTILADLARRLGVEAPRDLRSIRAAIAQAHPKYRFPEGRAGRRGRTSLAMAST